MENTLQSHQSELMPGAGQQQALRVFHSEDEGWKKSPKALEETEHNNKSAQYPNQLPSTDSRYEQKPPCVFPSEQHNSHPFTADADRLVVNTGHYRRHRAAPAPALPTHPAQSFSWRPARWGHSLATAPAAPGQKHRVSTAFLQPTALQLLSTGPSGLNTQGGEDRGSPENHRAV